MKAIVIGTDYGREDYLANCLRSLAGCRYPVVVLTEGRYELGKLAWMVENTNLSEFLFLHDSVELKHQEWLDEVFDYPYGVGLTDKPCPFGMYMGKYRMEVLRKLAFPLVTKKEDSVYFESHWTDQYYRADPASLMLWTDLDDEPHTLAERFGRQNLVLQNDHIIKYKGTWSLEQALAIDAQEGVK